MKPFWWILMGLALLVMVLAVPVIWRTQPSPDCTSNVVIVRGPDGEPSECVCVGGAISTCFGPGP